MYFLRHLEVWNCPFCILRGCQSKFLLNDASLKIGFILTNSGDSDEMPPYMEFHLGLHCLPKNLFTGIQNENV